MPFNNSVNRSELPLPGKATLGLHADDPDHITEPNYPLGPSLSLSSTFRLPEPNSTIGQELAQTGEAGLDWQTPPIHIYSRFTTETRGRTEKVLSSLLNANALTYASGLTAAYGAILHYSPKVIAIRKGYHGVHNAIKIFSRTQDVKVIDLDDEYPKLNVEKRGDGSETPKNGLLVWVETPLNPTGEARDLAHYAKRAHDVGGVIGVDSTFAPLQDVFEFGVDMVMHSATKYFGGHSDLLMGILATKDKKQWDQLFDDRSHFGGMPGNMESWLLLRSLRSLQVRWRQQSTTATRLAQWLQTLVQATSSGVHDINASPQDQKIIERGIVQRVWHASLQPRKDKDTSATPRFDEGKDFNPAAQMKNGWPATFAFRLSDKEKAATLPHETTYFAAATSLGGVESLLEHRLGSDPSEDPCLVRVSVGLEEFEDLQADLRVNLLKLTE